MVVFANFNAFIPFIIILFATNKHRVSSSAENYIIVAGGRNLDGVPVPKVKAYQVESRKWINGSELDRTKAAVFNWFWPDSDEGSYILNAGDSLIKIGGNTEYFRIDKWRSKKERVLHPLPYSRQGFREGACAAVHSGNAYLIGGLNAEKIISKLEEDSTKWIDQTNSLPLPRTYCGAVTFEDKIYVCGSDFPDNNVKKMYEATECFMYNIRSNEIWHMASMEYPRAGNFLVQHGAHLYAAGGYYHQAVERFNLFSMYKSPNGNEKWEVIQPSLSVGRKYAMAVSDGFDRIYLMGGVRPKSSRPDWSDVHQTNEKVEFYNVKEEKWCLARPIPVGVMAAGVLYVSFPDD